MIRNPNIFLRGDVGVDVNAIVHEVLIVCLHVGFAFGSPFATASRKSFHP